jgi:hypothetical protein
MNPFKRNDYVTFYGDRCRVVTTDGPDVLMEDVLTGKRYRAHYLTVAKDVL